MITLTQLCDYLGPELGSASAGRINSTVLTGVHISELTDPTPYLEGGELLLTTGIPLVGGAAAIQSYVQRLVVRGVAALGLGLGAGTDRVPETLRAACAGVGLHLLVVPAGIPFLHVSRAYWDLLGRAEQSNFTAGLKQQTSLARAATRPGAVGAVIQMLAEASGGWAAFLAVGDRTGTVWPTAQRSLLPRLWDETARLNLAGTYSSATFPLDGTEVVVHSIVVDRATVGFLAVGAGRVLRRADRQLLLTGCMLLAVSVQQERQLRRSNARLSAAVASLIVSGFPDAARLVVSEFDLYALPDRLNLLAISGKNLDALSAAELAELVDGLAGHHEVGMIGQRIRIAPLRAELNGLTVVLLEAAAEFGEVIAATDDLTASLNSRLAPAPFPEPVSAAPALIPVRQQSVSSQASLAADRAAATLSRAVRVDQVAALWPELSDTCRRVAPGHFVQTGDSRRFQADGWVDALRDHPRGDLVETVRSYLRHRGQWEVTARELGVHRNSLRNRIAVAAELIQVDFDDPDVAAHLWLALRGATGA